MVRMWLGYHGSYCQDGIGSVGIYLVWMGQRNPAPPMVETQTKSWDKPPIRWYRISSRIYIYIPVVPHKAVAEVSKIGNL